MLSLSRFIFASALAMALLSAPSNAAVASASFEARFVVVASCSVHSAAGFSTPRVDCPLSAQPLLIPFSSAPSATHSDGPVTTVYF